jgi:hypothetical protein
MRYFYSLIFLLLQISVLAQSGQLSIDRVAQMPDLPTPYLMRNWKQVAAHYDNIAFDTEASGQYLPLIGLKSTGINYPELSPILLQTYVGTNSSNQAEAINIIPAVVGATLIEINKSNQQGINWVEKTKDFFNKANGQNVYLNNYSATSGGDWWYDVMPNIFFYQLYTQYPSTSDFDTQFTTVADRWLEAINAMGASETPWTIPNMNYRAWNLSTMTGDPNGVKEPEAAGGLAWLLYHAYLNTGDSKYLQGAQHSIEFLNSLTANPSYELQLPYGALIAAKMNAELGTNYDISKIINWCFDRGDLRGWGVIAGTWNNVDVDGLIGEANDNGNDYAFAMNGFQQAAALMPLLKYDKRYTRAIAKWTLNLANASRLFYPQYLPAASQDDYEWSNTFDPQSAIAYEALKELWEGKPLYGTGDAKRNDWAETNLGLYGASHVGYMASIIDTTDVQGILKLDLNKTDFFPSSNLPNYVLYNPHPANKLVTIDLPAGNFDVYEALSETIIVNNASSNFNLTLKGDEAVLLVYVPAGAELTAENGQLVTETGIVDYHYGYNFTGKLRIKSLAAEDSLVAYNQSIPIYTSIDNASEAITYEWYEDGILNSTLTEGNFSWTVPEISGEYVLKLTVNDNGKSVSDSIIFNIVENIPVAPSINSITPSKKWYFTNEVVTFLCDATNNSGSNEELSYDWSTTGGNFAAANAGNITWQAPAAEGIYAITCEVTDVNGQSSTISKPILVKQQQTTEDDAFAYYPLDGNALDFSGNNRNGVMNGLDAVNDARGNSNSAYLFDASNDIIEVENTAELNFQEAITLSFWLKLNRLEEESFVLSHGSYEQRWKVSIIPDGLPRWTINTNDGIKDLDGSDALTFGVFHHYTVVYTGYSMEIYVDGELDTFVAHSGLLRESTKSLTFGRKDNTEFKYFLNGVLDEVRIYDSALSPDEITVLPTLWNTVTAIRSSTESFVTYPNPSKGVFYLKGLAYRQLKSLQLFDLNGKSVAFKSSEENGVIMIEITDFKEGLIFLRVQTVDEIAFKKILIY